MNIYLDNIIFSLQNFGGISVYWNEIRKRFFKQSEIKIVEIEPYKVLSLPQNVNDIVGRNILFGPRMPLYIARYLPVKINHENKSGIFHSSYFRYTNNKNLINVTTVHDFIYEKYMHGIRKLIHVWQKKRAIKHSKGIICISENTKKDLLKYCPKLDKKLVKVIYLSASKIFRKDDNINIIDTKFKDLRDKKIITFVGKRGGYKNFSIVIKILSRLSSNYHLLFVGGGSLSNMEKNELATISNKYTHVLQIDNNELNIIYNISFCCVYPSEYEGFGIPILEAMNAGCPVVCQKCSSVTEVYGKVENLVTKYNDTDEFVQCIKNLEDAEFRKKIISQGLENCKRFDWDKTCTETLDFYKLILNSNL